VFLFKDWVAIEKQSLKVFQINDIEGKVVVYDLVKEKSPYSWVKEAMYIAHHCLIVWIC
jgi:hypothetical protein